MHRQIMVQMGDQKWQTILADDTLTNQLEDLITEHLRANQMSAPSEGAQALAGIEDSPIPRIIIGPPLSKCPCCGKPLL